VSAAATQSSLLAESVKSALIYFHDDEEPHKTVTKNLSSLNETVLQELTEIDFNSESSGTVQKKAIDKINATSVSSEKLEITISSKNDNLVQEQPLPDITESTGTEKQRTSATIEKEISLSSMDQGLPTLEDEDLQLSESLKIEPEPAVLNKSFTEKNAQQESTPTTVFKLQSEVSYKDTEVYSSPAPMFKGLPRKKAKHVSAKQEPLILHDELPREKEVGPKIAPTTAFKLQRNLSPKDPEIEASSAHEYSNLPQKKAKPVNGKLKPPTFPDTGPRSTLADVFKLKSNASYKNAEEEAKAEAIIKQRQNDMEMVKRYVAQKEKDKLELSQVLGNKDRAAKKEDVNVIVPNLQDEKEINSIFLKKGKGRGDIVKRMHFKRFLKKRYAIPAFLTALIVVAGRRLLFL